MKKDLLSGLNKSQMEAVTHKAGPVLVVAGAGTGKTTVITRRIAWLIEEKLAAPEEILALTFTEKAALEMEERVDELVPYGFVDTYISTFHAFGDRILRDHAIELDLSVDFRVLSETEQLMFMREHIFEFSLERLRPLNNPYRYARDLLRYFSKIKDEDIGEEEYLKYAGESLKKAKTEEEIEEAERQLEIAKCFAEYNNLLHDSGYIDFGDQVVLLLKLFRENSRILARYQKQFKYILVDEFQDTNYAQNELLKLLSEKGANIMVVGDDDQSIYQFRGAALSNILDFIKNFPKAKQIVLTENYRSGKEILDKSHDLISQNNPERLEVTYKIDKRLKAKEGSSKVSFSLSQTISAEADKVAETIKEEIKAGTPENDIAILVRRNSDIETFEKALNVKGIPSVTSSGVGLYARPEIISLVSFIQVVANPFENLAHFHLLTSDIYRLPIEAAVYMNGLSARHPGSLEEVYREVLELGAESGVDQKSRDILDVYLSDLEEYRKASKELTAGQLVYQFLKESGYLKELLRGAGKDAEAEEKVQNISVFFEKIKGFDSVSLDKSIHNFYRNLDDLIKAGENPATAEIDPDLRAVNIITIHKAKGLEFDVVFMVNLANECFPVRRQHVEFEVPKTLIKQNLSEGNTHLPEERRLFYVGMTRAKKKLYLSASVDHGGKKKYKISQFVTEALGRSFETAEKYKLSAEEKITEYQKEPELKKMLARFIADDKTIVLTPHQIDDYLSCPLKFKYVHVFRIPLMPNHAVTYGSAIHAAVEYYLKSKKRGTKVTPKDLYQVFEERWSKEGFYTREHEEKRFREGKVALENFFSRIEKSQDLPDKIEEPFSFVLGGGEGRTKINGRYDAVYKRGDKIEIRDFKTSKVKTEKEAQKRAKDNNQIAIYALSHEKNTGQIPDTVSLYFVDSGLLGEAKKTEKQLEVVEENILKVAEGIREADFSARPAYGECTRCAFNSLCPKKQG
ncbi:MAG: ATP-dependent DNA helicase [Patescibacteria group bacterium]|nr:ATP-dependent DNA helicase [Patescibacteria group bacterium]